MDGRLCSGCSEVTYSCATIQLLFVKCNYPTYGEGFRGIVYVRERLYILPIRAKIPACTKSGFLSTLENRIFPLKARDRSADDFVAVKLRYRF